MAYNTLLDDGQDRFKRSLTHLTDQLLRIRTGRATTALVDQVRVDYYGTPTPLAQMASVSIPEPRQILVKPFDVSIIKEVVKALGAADLGSAPQDDGKVVRLVLPPLSGEQRKKYSSKVKEIGEETRVALRNTRRDLNKHADVLQKDGELTEDDNRKLHDEIQKMLKEYEGQVDKVIGKKVTEIEDV